MYPLPDTTTHPTPPFPMPTFRTGKRRYWKLSGLRNWEAEAGGEELPEPLAPEAEKFLTSKQVRERYGVSDMWIWRRLELAREAADDAS